MQKPVQATLVYAFREQRKVMAWKQGKRSVLVDRSDYSQTDDPNLAKPLFYGVVWNKADGGLWIANKSKNLLEEHKFNRGGKLEYIRSVSTSVDAPCAMQFDPALGLIVGCYGKSGANNAGVIGFHNQKWQRLTPVDYKGYISHCCWLSDGRFAYVSRTDSVIWIADPKTKRSEPLTAPNNNRLSPNHGAAAELHLRYVQGLTYSKARDAILVADASLGAIYAVSVKNKRFELLAGRPMLSDSSNKADLRGGSASVWLGPVRALAELQDGSLVFLDGETGRLFLLPQDATLVNLDEGMPATQFVKVTGCGICEIVK